MKKIYILPIVAAILLTLILIKIVLQSKKEEKKAATPVQQAVQAECIIARDTLVDFTFKAVGNIRANEQVELVSELSLRLVSIHFREGNQVHKGQLLFQLDDAAIRADLMRVDTKLDFAVQTEKRNEGLLATGGISQQLFDESVHNRKILEAEKASLMVLHEKTRIKAPFTGVIGIRNVSEGAFVTPGILLTTLEDISRLKIDFTVSEAYVGLIRQGKRFSFRLDGIPGFFSAIVEAINPSVNNTSGNLRVLAFIDDPSPRLKAGTAVSINLLSKAAVPALYLPSQSLLPIPGGYHIYVMSNGKADYRKVTTGIRTESMVEIVDGAVPGDSVLVTGFMRIRPNSNVQIIKVW